MNEWRRGEYLITTDPGRVDLEVVHGYLEDSYWAKDIPFEICRRSIENSLNFSVYHGEAQVGFCRVISDHATFGYLADVFVLESHRGRGLSKWMMELVFAHPDLQGFRRWVLLTRDAHGLYQQFGFTPIAAPDRYMELWKPGAYARERK